MTPAESKALRTAAGNAHHTVATRDRLIREAHERGASLREIATATGTLTHSGVARIVKRAP